jgi:hypothetical protein
LDSFSARCVARSRWQLAVGIFVWVLTLPLPFGQFAARKPRGRLVRLWQSFAMRLANWLHKHID